MRKGLAFAALAAAAAMSGSPVFGSADPGPYPIFIDRGGGSPAERTRLFGGRLGMVTARSPEPLLYLDWRLLHGLAVGPAAGAALTAPCCGEPASLGPGDGVYGWLDARAIVPEAGQSPSYLPTERSGPDYTSIPNCFRDAFDTATATLRDRAARYGKGSPALLAWLRTQDAVFDSCASEGAVLPPLMAGAPDWLKADRAYQEAAFALYNRRNGEAAQRFAAIAGDPSSPWRSKGLYLRVRALEREALAGRAPEAIARARSALHELAAAPAGTYGRGEVRKMLRALAYRDRPERLLAELDSELGRPEADGDIAFALRDYLLLSEKAPVRPEVSDWIETLQAGDGGPGLPHARERWAATKDPAWLIAALSLLPPDDPAAPALAAEAAAVRRGEPAWLTAQYHLTRLTIAGADPAATRSRLDSILADPGLTMGERNLFAGARAQVAADLAELARFSLREASCGGPGEYCVGDDWARYDGHLAPHRGGWVGFGADARAIIDRLPLAQRIALSRSAALPGPLRLDVALTSFARAVQLGDEGAVGDTARDLALLLPQLRRDWQAIAAARPGPARRFAEAFAMAKLPGLRADLIAFSYTRPVGTVAEFQGRWTDWMIVPRGAGAPPGRFPEPSAYQSGYYYDDTGGTSDLTCLGNCGRSAFPLHLPAFVAAAQGRAAAERAAFRSYDEEEPAPAGASSLWEEALAYARAHPRDPRSPEMLHRLIRVARWGANHDHLGRRAFQLLHARHPGNAWTRRSPYYYDD
ncbi:MAG TPA: hypothetical protein VFQ67_06615 [Allosphingosinicella sp.]|jgi:hypothetical protein|nr:hypothetical protein [Allosphingosinicella sp.]